MGAMRFQSTAISPFPRDLHVKPQPKLKPKAAEETQVFQEPKENDQPDLLPPDTEVES